MPMNPLDSSRPYGVRSPTSPSARTTRRRVAYEALPSSAAPAPCWARPTPIQEPGHIAVETLPPRGGAARFEEARPSSAAPAPAGRGQLHPEPGRHRAGTLRPRGGAGAIPRRRRRSTPGFRSRIDRMDRASPRADRARRRDRSPPCPECGVTPWTRINRSDLVDDLESEFPDGGAPTGPSRAGLRIGPGYISLFFRRPGPSDPSRTRVRLESLTYFRPGPAGRGPTPEDKIGKSFPARS